MRTPPNERLTSDIAEPAPSAKSDASGNERRCVLCGESFPRETLIRLAISPDGEVLPDPQGKAPGRGAWITPNRTALEKAIGEGHLRRSLLRAFKGGPDGTALSYAEDLPQRIADALTRSLLDRLGLEMRGGNIVLGAARIEEQARTGRIDLLLHASDASEDGRKRLDQAWRVGRDVEGSGERGVVLPLDRTALSVALGRENVVHLGVSDAKSGPGDAARASVRVERAVCRLTRYLGCDPP
ncbi:MAG: DUF448 domain-containing protein [Erythrobacter sp.]|jgi:predicted RNA-binding protein YlxR (DUF448 family)|nr:DUF448 domain-containing protein [Erythrobacter sp.]